MMKGYMLFLIACSVHSSAAAVFGGPCTINDDCTETGQMCNNTCVCYTANNYIRVGNKCVKELGRDCTITAECNDVNVICDSNGKCQCNKATHYDSNGDTSLGGSCIAKHALGQSCTNPAVAPNTVQCSAANAFCKAVSGGTGYTCQCNVGFYSSGENCVQVTWGTWGDFGTCSLSCGDGTQTRTRTCTPRGATCSQGIGSQQVSCNLGSCVISECSGGYCSCQSGYYKTADGQSGRCEKRYLGESCSETTPCSLVANSQCSSGYCECKSGFYKTADGSSGTCTKRYLGESCSAPTHCSLVANSECIGGVCSCQSGHYKTADGQSGRCEKRHLDESCTADSQCTEGNSECRSGKCLCKSGYFQIGTGSSGTCTDKALGETCNEAATEAECSDPAAECLNKKCACNTYSYDNNGQVGGGTCMAISNLQVSNVGFSSIQNDQITVNWTTPKTYKQFINRFKVTWRPTNNNNVNTESADLGSSITSYTMTRGIDPGRAYTVTIISINDQTQQGSSRTTSVVRYQAAKPSITSGIDDPNSDKDISGDSIKVAWNNAPGYKSDYNVELKDGETVKFTRTVNGVSATFSSSGLKNGYNYDVTIQAKSEHFDNRKTVLGDIFTSKFKTTAKLPEPPRNGVCKDPTDSSILLDWETPTNPNGDLVQYNINVFKHGNLVFNNISSTGTRTDKTVGNLELGTFYTFKIYTVNEVGHSTSSLQISFANCKTKARMSTMPENLQIQHVTSRSFLISWDKPVNTFSDENYGYVLQVKDEQDRCKEEVLYRCSDCSGTYPTSKVSGLCFPNKQSDFYKTSAELARQLSYNASLNPGINYTVIVTAITDEGRGYPVTVTQRTKEEVPQTPYDVKVVGKTATTFDITWNINGPRPGQTTYVIILIADAPAESKNFTATGFALREYKAFGLQEYWNYSVTVKASTSVGSRKSAVTNEYRTSPAAPGKVTKFSIEPHPDEDFTKMKISWEMPTILERNGVIKSYRFENYEPGNVTATTNFQQNRLGYTYTKTVVVVPEEQYTFRVFAINEQNMEGEHIMVTKMAPPGVPLNIEESLLMDVIDLQREKTERQITITLVQEFFEESTNGKVQTTGLVVCVNSCDFEGVMTIIDVNAMENWTGASKKGLTSYRATKSDWLDRAKTQCSCGRNKREVTNIEFIVGSEDCKNVSPDEFCNGPLQPGTSYKFVAFTCTNGGCLLSRQYGPFTTANADTHCPECYTTNTHAVIVGVVLGLIIIILLLYAGYATYLIRRYRAKDEQEIKFKKQKDRKSQTYVNETFMTGLASNTSGNFNVDSEVQNVYSRLDDNAREDKTTYESLRP